MGIELLGAEELIRELKKFGPDVTDLATEKGIKKAAAQVRKDFRAAAPRETGMLKSSLGSKYSRRGRTAWVGLRASRKDAKRGKKRGSGARTYYKVLEFGRQPYKKANGYTYRGSPAMRPFMKKTFGRNVTKYANLIIRESNIAVTESALKVKERQQRALIRAGGKRR